MSMGPGDASNGPKATLTLPLLFVGVLMFDVFQVIKPDGGGSDQLFSRVEWCKSPDELAGRDACHITASFCAHRPERCQPW